MKVDDLLAETFNATRYRLSGHGLRQVEVLYEALSKVDPHQQSDYYGHGPLIESFQDKMADYLGHEAAIFFPSGTMAQQIALRIWCDGKNLSKVAYHPLCHLEIHEENGLKVLHGIEPVILADPQRLIELQDLQALSKEIACLLLELPQREMGGVLPPYSTLQAISSWCEGKGVRRHLDGARLYECLPYYATSARDVAQLFDSVYISFYKGIGAVAGAVLAGPTDFIQEAVVWKRRHGGDLISLYPYIVAADYYFEVRVAKMEQYWHQAQELAGFFNQLDSVHTKPLVPVTNMFHAYFDRPKDYMAQLFAMIGHETDIGFTGILRETAVASCYFEISVGDMYETIPRMQLQRAFDHLRAGLSRDEWGSELGSESVTSS